MDSEDTEEEEDQFQIFAYLGTKKKVDDAKLNKLIETIDIDGNGQIEFSEFVGHCMSRRQLTRDNIRILFNDILETKKFLIKQEME